MDPWFEENGCCFALQLIMMPIPPELIVMVGVLVLLTLLCSWAIRADWRLPNGRTDWWELIEASVSIFLMLAMLVSSALQVVVRYLFSDNVDIPWTEEFGRLAMIWAAFWGAAALQRVDDHIRMSAVYDLLPSGIQKAVRLFGDIIVLLVLVPIVWLGWENARSLDVMNSISLGLPLSIFAYPVPIGGALMMAHTAALLIGRLLGREPKPSEAGFGA
jgi:TRAP-type C4-dicarboxylate transport system permease small subunit